MDSNQYLPILNYLPIVKTIEADGQESGKQYVGEKKVINDNIKCLQQHCNRNACSPDCEDLIIQRNTNIKTDHNKTIG